MGDSYIKDLWIAVQKEDGNYGEPFRWSSVSRLQFKTRDYDDLDYECPCFTCGCMIDRTGCQHDLCTEYQQWERYKDYD